MSDSTPSAAAEQEVLITRIFDATREQVFPAWIDPDEVATWYGPEHMEAPRAPIRIDARVGGRWELTMVPRSGSEGFSIGYDIVELVEPELLSCGPTQCLRWACTSQRSPGWNSTTTATRRG